jgi:hypothetical protein
MLAEWFGTLAPEAREIWLAKIADKGARTETQVRLEADAAREERAFEQEMQRRDMDAKWTERQHELALQADRRLYRLVFIESIMRAVLAAILVFGTVGAVFYGIWEGVDSDTLSQYLAPVTGLAGLAVGYFFARATAGGQTPTTSSEPTAPATPRRSEAAEERG